jgi:tripeptide aminopeptidase
MTLAAELMQNPNIPHGDVRICFTPDEEIGRGVDHLTVEDLGADFAYTLDGGNVGEITYETFSADKAVITIEGVSIHPGSAKGKMVNALQLAARFIMALPEYTRTPETTGDRQGFIHLYEMNGSAASAELRFILRDFELAGLRSHGETIQAVANALQLGEPRARITCSITPQYRNMRYWLEDNMEPVESALEAIKQAGIEPVVEPVRGGTDGSRLTEIGVPTPNLFAGMHNPHSELEWVSLQDMAAATEVCLNLIRLWAHRQANNT